MTPLLISHGMKEKAEYASCMDLNLAKREDVLKIKRGKKRKKRMHIRAS